MKKQKQIHRCEWCNAELSTKRKYCNDVCCETHLCAGKGTTKYKTVHVAPSFQRMMRAEWGANSSSEALAVSKGKLILVKRSKGQCVCVTCGTVCPWEGGRFEKRLNCGHFLAGRGSILFEEECVAPQCAGCNMHHRGRPLEFRVWMAAVRGEAVIERLERLKHQPLSRTREQLVTMRIEFDRRLKAAIEKMKGNQ